MTKIVVAVAVLNPLGRIEFHVDAVLLVLPVLQEVFMSNGIDTLDKFIDGTLFNFTQKSTGEINLTNSSRCKILKTQF